MKFLVDHMLGKLAKGLRMLGYDTLYSRGEDSHRLLMLCREQGRTLLTRNTKLVPESPEDQIIHIRKDNPYLQMTDLLRDGHVSLQDENLFTRCLRCNTLLLEISRQEAQGRVPDFVYSHHMEFFQCPACRRIYWKGSHQTKMQQWIDSLKKEVPNPEA